MYIHEYGDPSDPKMLFLHPMCLTGENIYQYLLPYLKGKYCIIAPDQGGHGQSGPYVSLEEELAVLTDYLLGKNYTDILFLYGASMGVTVASELLKDPRFHFHRIWFDGGGFMNWTPRFQGMIAVGMRVGLFFFRLYAKITGKVFARAYGEKFAPVMRENFAHLSNNDIIHILGMFTQRAVTSVPEEVQYHMHLEWGEEDANYKKSKEAIEREMPHAEVVLREGYGHCGYMAFHTEEYIREVEAFAISAMIQG